MGENQSLIPRRESIIFFENAIRSHSKVKSIEKISNYYYRINRVDLKSIDVLITNHYTIGLADYYEIYTKYPNVDGIVTISNWNGYTPQVKETAKTNNVGIFVFEEFMGALNINDIYSYIKRDHNGNTIKFSRGR